MNSIQPVKQPLPDITSTESAKQRPLLDWVGMTRLAIHFQLLDSHLGSYNGQGYAEIGVDLSNPNAKGIHMSRLYLGLEQFFRDNPLTPLSLQQLLSELLQTQQDLSQSVSLGLDFELMPSRPSLKSQLSGIKAYPIRLHSWQSDDDSGLAVELTIPYSSACPCSTSLTKAHIKQALDQHFDNQTVPKEELFNWLDTAGEDFPIPHSQRSYARIRLQLDDSKAPIFTLIEWIDAIENCLETPVQTAVKREDELAFAQRNGANPMFCEDAARRITTLLECQHGIQDYWVEVEHQESLHAHNAVARASKQNHASHLFHWRAHQRTEVKSAEG